MFHLGMLFALTMDMIKNKKPLLLLASISALSFCFACGESVAGESDIGEEISSLMSETSEDSAADPCDFESRRAEFLATYDTDGDGSLSREEKRAAREAKRERFFERFDANADGSIDDAEREEARAARQERREARRARIVQCFDTDGDGELSETEREAVREALPRKPRHRRGGGERSQERPAQD